MIWSLPSKKFWKWFSQVWMLGRLKLRQRGNCENIVRHLSCLMAISRLFCTASFMTFRVHRQTTVAPILGLVVKSLNYVSSNRLSVKIYWAMISKIWRRKIGFGWNYCYISRPMHNQTCEKTEPLIWSNIFNSGNSHAWFVIGNFPA